MDRRHRPLLPPQLRAPLAAIWALCMVASACTNPDAAEPVPTVDTGDLRFPDVVAVESELDDGLWTFSVTISSPYDSAEQYADAWRVLGPDGSELGVRILTHDHANEQPFTRSLRGVRIPDDVETVTVQARDLVNGWGGGTLEHDLGR